MNGNFGQPDGEREIVLTAASGIDVRPVKWLDEGRIPVGGLTLLAGREGVGKSTYAYTLAADVTRGRLPGVYFGAPRSVIVAATEDSWDRTIVPRLMAAGADLDLVYRIEVVCEGYDTALSLPQDLAGLECLIREKGTALVIFDPLLSRLAAHLDTHKDAEVRRALEPLVKVADLSGAAVIGLIHVSKSSTTDPLTSIMASRAFTAVPRAILFMALDPDDAEVRLIGAPKNAWGKTDTTTRACRIDGVKVADTDEGEVWTGKLIWAGERAQSIRDVLEAQLETAESRSATGEAKMWLSDYLESKGGSALRKDILDAGRLDGHSAVSLRRAREQLSLRDENVPGSFPRQTVWKVREINPPSRVTQPTSLTTSTTSTTGHTHSGHAMDSPSGASGASAASGVVPTRAREDEPSRPRMAPRSDLRWPASMTAHGSDAPPADLDSNVTSGGPQPADATGGNGLDPVGPDLAGPDPLGGAAGWARLMSPQPGSEVDELGTPSLWQGDAPKADTSAHLIVGAEHRGGVPHPLPRSALPRAVLRQPVVPSTEGLE